jgi:predicted CoA-binding protein
MSTESSILKSCHVVAVVGCSANEERASYRVAKYLKEHGYKVIPVNPEVLGEVCYPDLTSIPESVEVVDIFRKSEDVPSIVEQAVKIGAKAVWMQEGIVNDNAAGQARAANIMVVMDRCMLKEHQHLQSGK